MDSNIISNQFIDSYKDKTPPWGFNGLGYIVYKRCVTIDTPVLCADLTWRPAGDLPVGTEIVGFEEGSLKREVKVGRPRRIVKAHITHNTVEEADCVEIELDDGTKLYSTPDHSWLAHTGYALEWVEAQDLVHPNHLDKQKETCYSLPRYCSVWEQDTSYRAGYLAAAFDGEGSVDRRRTLSFTQVDNEMLATVRQYLDEYGFQYHVTRKSVSLAANGTSFKSTKSCFQISIYGNAQVMRFLGMFRPKRLLRVYMALPADISMRRRDQALHHRKVVRVTPVGKRKIAVISTSSKTHITGGFPSHNTYSRLKDDGSNEEWFETVGRCVNGAQKIGAGYTREEAERLYDHVFHLRCNFAGRMLWQLGTDMVEKLAANSLLNCLAAETQVLTRDGWKPIASLVGQTVEVCTSYGKWVEAPVRSFGVQALRAVTFANRNGSKQWRVNATPNHRWLLIDKQNTGRTEAVTDDLKIGDKVPLVRAKNSSQYLSPQGIQHGLVFGDGSCNGYESFVDLIDNTYDECKGFFVLNRVSWVNPENPRHVRFGGMPNYYKQLPSIRENKSYLLGFLAGWIAADGSVNKATGSIRLFSATRANLLFARDVAAICGFRTGDPYLERDINPYNGEPSELWSISFVLSDNPELLVIRSDHRGKMSDPSDTYDNYARVVSIMPTDRLEEVYCATVEDTHSFVIDGNILTGNCWFVTVNEPKAFLFLFENLMLGGGVGYSVRREDVHELPRIKKGVRVSHLATKDADFIVPDSRQGWIKLLGNVLDAFYVTGKSFTYSTILVRGAGEKINGFGGTASGPKILIDGITNIVTIFQGREEKKLRSIDVLDICDIIGSIVVAGNVRRSAEIALGDPDDYLYIRAKNWSLGSVPNWRAMSNNTIYADSYDHISDELWTNGYTLDAKTGQAKGEPYGFFNLPLSQRYGRLKDGPMKDSKLYPEDRDNCVGTNPCAEISLSSYECCNLSELYLNNVTSKDQLIDCAKLLYKTQKAIAAMPFLHDETNEIVHRNMRLGLGVTGVCQSLDKVDWLDDCYVELRKLDAEWSKQRGWPQSIKLTTVKPSGTLSLLAGATPGVHPAYSKYYIRRVRMGSGDKLAKSCRDLGYNVEYVRNFDGSENHDTVVVDFPCQTPEGAILIKDMTVLKQLDMVAKLQSVWSDNAVSVTAYYKPEELPALKEWLSEHYKDNVKSVSFLLYSEHGFQQAPYQEITEDQYNEMSSKVRPIGQMEVLQGAVLEGVECLNGICPVR